MNFKYENSRQKTNSKLFELLFFFSLIFRCFFISPHRLNFWLHHAVVVFPKDRWWWVGYSVNKIIFFNVSTEKTNIIYSNLCRFYRVFITIFFSTVCQTWSLLRRRQCCCSHFFDILSQLINQFELLLYFPK